MDLNLSLYLAQLLGLYLLIAGLIVMIRKQSLVVAVGDLKKHRGLILLLAFVELAAGLALVIAHPVFEFSWQGLITALGITLICEAILYLSLPYTRAERLIRHFNKPAWYSSGSVIAIVFGAYLAGIGFGLI